MAGQSFQNGQTLGQFFEPLYDPPDQQSLMPLSTYEQEPSDGISTGPQPHDDDLVLGLDSSINDLKKMACFIDTLQGATLEQSNMRQEDIDRLHMAEPDPCLDVVNRHLVKALRVFLSTTNALQTTYNAICSTLNECYPDDPFLSFWQMQQCIEQLSGMVPISHDMCPDTCIGYTGPFINCDHCPICGKEHYQTGT